MRPPLESFQVSSRSQVRAEVAKTDTCSAFDLIVLSFPPSYHSVIWSSITATKRRQSTDWMILDQKGPFEIGQRVEDVAHRPKGASQ
jgi:hypothetical protein